MTEHAVQSVRPVATGDSAAASPFSIGPSFSDLTSSSTGRVAFTQRRFAGEPGEIVLWWSTPSTDDRLMLSPHGHSPVWSTDGRMLAFIADRHRDEIVILADVEAPREPTMVRLGSDAIVESIMWMPQSRKLVAVVAPPDADGSVTDGALRPPGRGWPAIRRSSLTARRIVVVDIDGPAISWTDLGTTSVWEAAAFPDGRFVAVVSDDSTESGWYRARLSIIDEFGEHPLHISDWQVACPSPSPSGDLVAFVEGWSSDRGRLTGDLVVLDPSNGEIILRTNDTMGLDVMSLRWLDDATIWVSGWSGVRAAWATIELPTGRRIDGATIDSAVSLDRFPREVVARLSIITVGDDGRPAVEIIEGDAPTDRTSASGSVALERSIIQWLSPDGLEIEGILVRGTDHPPTDQRLIVMVHGGPASLWTDVPPVGARALVGAGYSVLLPNPRGSVGRGQQFARANLGDPGGMELDDILAGAAACRHRGLVMDASPGIVGGSYGGYLTACAAVFSTEVAAAVAMFGHPDLLSARLGSNNGAFYDYLLAGRDGSIDRDLAYDRSPAFHVDRDVAPMLLLHGDRDACTPLGQSEELFGALVAEGVEAELVVYEGSGHGLRGIQTQEDAWRRTIAWFDRHLEEGPGC